MDLAAVKLGDEARVEYTFMAFPALLDEKVSTMEITLQRKSPLCIPFLGIARPQPQFQHSCVYERFI
jgi:hypothetical protein